MKLDNSLLVLILVVLFFTARAEVQNGVKSRGDVAAKSSDSNNNDESEEEATMEDLENAFEQLKELKALRDTLLKLVPTSDTLLNEKLSKGFLDSEKKDDTEKGGDVLDDADKESAKSVWIKSAADQGEGLSLAGKKADNEEENWEDILPEDLGEEEEPEVLTLEQQEGIF